MSSPRAQEQPQIDGTSHKRNKNCSSHHRIAEFSSESLIVSLLREVLFIESFNNQYESGAISFSSVAQPDRVIFGNDFRSEHKRQPDMESWFCCSTLASERREQWIFIGDHRSFISLMLTIVFPRGDCETINFHVRLIEGNLEACNGD